MQERTQDRQETTSSKAQQEIKVNDVCISRIYVMKFKSGTNNFTAGNKRTRCGMCDGCLTSDCGKCKHCQDKKKFGGPGKLKKACLKRECHGMSQITSHTNTSLVTSSSSKIENKCYNIILFTLRTC